MIIPCYLLIMDIILSYIKISSSWMSGEFGKDEEVIGIVDDMIELNKKMEHCGCCFKKKK